MNRYGRWGVLLVIALGGCQGQSPRTEDTGGTDASEVPGIDTVDRGTGSGGVESDGGTASGGTGADTASAIDSGDAGPIGTDSGVPEETESASAAETDSASGVDTETGTDSDTGDSAVTPDDSAYAFSDFEVLRTTPISSDPRIRWRQFGPGMSGNNYRIYWHPTDASVMFLGPNMGNAYRSVDAGATYEPVLNADGPWYKTWLRGPIEINEPTFSRQDPDFGFCSGESAPYLYVTHDRGATWEPLVSLAATWGNNRVNAIAVDPNDDRTWFVGSGYANDINHYTFTRAQPHGTFDTTGQTATIWRSTDRGRSFTPVTPADLPPQAQIVRILVHPVHSQVVFAATTYGFYKSTDGGDTWRPSNAGFDYGIVRSLDMHVDATTHEVTLYAIDLVQWKRSGNTVVTEGGGVFRSDDEGETWTKINGDLGVDMRAVGTVSSVRNEYFKTMNAWFGIGNAATELSELPAHILQGYSVVRVHPADRNKIFVLNDYKHYGADGSFPPGMLWRTDDGGAHWFVTLRNGTAWEGVHQSYWKQRNNPTRHNMVLRAQRKWTRRDPYERKAGGALAISPDGSVIAFQWAKVLAFSTNGGDDWFESDETETAPGSEVWYAAGDSNLPGHGLVWSPHEPGTLYLPSGENDLWVARSAPRGPGPVRQGAKRLSMGDGEFSCSSVAFHPTDPQVLFTLQFRQAHAGALLRSDDGGATFQPVGTAMPWPADASTNDAIHQLDLTVDPADPDVLYFVVPRKPKLHGYTDNLKSATRIEGVRRSTDGGKTWQWVNAGLPDSRDTLCLRLDPADSGRIFTCVYGTGGGLFVSTDRGEHWERFPTLPPGVESVADLHFDARGWMYLSTGTPQTDWNTGGVWRSEDGGVTWTHLFASPWVRRTVTAAYDPDVILVQVNGAADIVNPGTFLSRDGGATWRKINTGNHQSDRVNDIAIDPTQPDVYYVSTYGAGWMRADRVD